MSIPGEVSPFFVAIIKRNNCLRLLAGLLEIIEDVRANLFSVIFFISVCGEMAG